jgi:copper chaperone CopZ
MSIETKSDQTQISAGLPVLEIQSKSVVVGSETKRTSKGELISKLGTVLSAILASSCCWLPLLLLALGVSGAGVASALATYRPVFIAVTVLFLGSAFYFTYRPKRKTAGGDCCAGQTATTDCCGQQVAQVDCCGNPIVAFNDHNMSTPVRKSGFNMLAINKIMLWVVTVMAVFFMFFPGYVSKWLGARNDVITGNMRRVVLKVDGMFCEGCAPIAKKALHKAPGVLAVEIDYEKSRATVGLDPDQPLDEQSLLDSLEKVDFHGQLLKSQ